MKKLKVRCRICKKYRFIDIRSAHESIKSYIKRRPRCRACGNKKRIRTLNGKAPNWKGGVHIDKKGYVRIYDRSITAYVKKHQAVWKRYRGSIPIGHVIHHKDGDKTNNKISNLECMPKIMHDKMNPLISKLAHVRWGNKTLDQIKKELCVKESYSVEASARA